jgi:hypothetical protein
MEDSQKDVGGGQVPVGKRIKYYHNIIGLFLLLLLGAILFEGNKNIFASVDSADKHEWKQSEKSLQDGTLPAQYSILEVEILNTLAGNPQLSFRTIEQKLGYAPKYQSVDGGYELTLIADNGKVVKSYQFSIPEAETDILPLTEEEAVVLTMPETEIVTSSNFILTVPWEKQATQLQIHDPQGKIIATIALTTLEEKKPNQQFRSIKGDEFLKGNKKTSFLERISTKAFAETGETLDITFIGDDYTTVDSLNTFHSDVDRFITTFLTYEPYQSRASQILFHYVDNVDDLGCAYSGRYIMCNYSLVNQKVNAAGAPHDRIVTMVNNSTYGGGTYGESMSAYNGSSGPQVFVHEFGHGFTHLRDEYTTGTGGIIDGTVDKNCYKGTPPALAWEGIVALVDYVKGCSGSEWYRSSSSSIMYALATPYFNNVSQKIINDYIDVYAGPFVNTVAPIVTVAPLTGGTTVSSTVAVNATASDDLGVAYVEFWKDGILQKTLYKAPYTFTWVTTNDTNGPHTIEVRAHDSTGNIGTSGQISVEVNNAPIDTINPSVNITNPVNGAIVTQNTIVAITATATDNVAVAKVQFYAGNKLICTAMTPDSSGLYTCSWKVPKGSGKSYVLKATATDTSQRAASTQVTVTSK